ncbi:MAG: CoA pyrophosphatase [Actinomycetes bacterium]
MNEQTWGRLHVSPSSVPSWFGPLLDSIRSGDSAEMARFARPHDIPARESAVLVLFGQTQIGPDVLLIERSDNLRSHSGQPAFPGGRREDADSSAIATALREAQEETRLDPNGVTVVAELPGLWLPPSGSVVAPVIGWWHEPSPVSVGDPVEVAAVHRIPVADMVEPENRVRVSHPSGYVGPGFEVGGMLVWGFTAMILDRLFVMAGWERPWHVGARVVPFDDGYRVVGSGDPT